MRLFVDTWGWIALSDRAEAQHKTAKAILQDRGRVRSRVITSDYVLDETFTLVFLRRPFPEAWRFARGLMMDAASGTLRVEAVSLNIFRSALELRQRFADKPRISFTDLTSMAIMRELQTTEILTADAHFQQVGMGFRRLPS
jgi:uncharacterized protein